MRPLILFLLPFLPWLATGQNTGSTTGTHPDSLIVLATRQMDASQYQAAFRTLESIRSPVVENEGKAHPAFIESFSVEAQLHWRMANYKAALQAADSGLSLQLKHYGKETALYRKLLLIRATLKLETADYMTAEEDFLECLILGELLFGKESLQNAMTLNNLANLYSDIGEFDKAHDTHQEALRIRASLLGTESQEYAMTLNNLGRLYLRMGAYEKSIDYLTHAIEVLEKSMGPGHPFIAMPVHNIAIAHTELGQYLHAEKKFKESLDLIAGSLGMDHPNYAFALNDLGLFYDRIGLNDQAYECLTRSFEIKKKNMGPEHLSVLSTLSGLAKYHQEHGQLDQAAKMYTEVLEVFQRTYGSDHPENLTNRTNLANVLLLKGEIAGALSLHQAVIAVRRQTQGVDHPDLVPNLFGISSALYRQGIYDQALAMLREAAKILDQKAGPYSLERMRMHHQFINIHWKMGHQEQVLLHADTAYFLLSNHLMQSAQHLSAHELQRKIPVHEPVLDLVRSAWTQFGRQHPHRMGMLFEDALRFKGMLLDNTLTLEKMMATAADSTRAIYLEWKVMQRRLSEALTQAQSAPSKIRNLQQRAESLEKELLQFVHFQTATEKVRWSAVQAQLAHNDAAIEFIRFNLSTPESSGNFQYAAIVLRPEWPAPRWIPLCEEQQLTALLGAGATRQLDYVDRLFRPDQNTSLFQLVWQPLESVLEGADRIYFAPTGILHRIPLAAIPSGEHEPLGDRYVFHQVGSCRQLIPDGKPPREDIRTDALILGGIDYDLDSSSIAAAFDPRQPEMAAFKNPHIDFSRAWTQNGAAWQYLPWTEVEAKLVDAMFTMAGISSKLLSGVAASEENLRSTGVAEPSPRILHIATHGYFFPDPEDGGSDREPPDREPVFKTSEHPMIRSGLVLAGANHVWTGGEPPEGLEDGILTAYEVSQMNLSNTELVVLSACETGLGDIEGNEGVYGLQRAFKIAGARYVLMSLWQVPDFVTQELMTVFYSTWLQEGLTIPEAFRQAQMHIRKDHPEPWYWAGFVLVE